jgi:hypothetical protein
MRYTHTNLDAKRNATQRLEGFSDNLVHQIAAAEPKSVTNHPTKSCGKLYLETEEWVSG